MLSAADGAFTVHVLLHLYSIPSIRNYMYPNCTNILIEFAGTHLGECFDLEKVMLLADDRSFRFLKKEESTGIRWRLIKPRDHWL